MYDQSPYGLKDQMVSHSSVLFGTVSSNISSGAARSCVKRALMRSSFVSAFATRRFFPVFSFRCLLGKLLSGTCTSGGVVSTSSSSL